MNIKEKCNEFRTIVNKMADLYEKKNSNYGDSFGQLYKELGPTAGLVPLWNKLHRATSLIKGNKNNFESLEDTLKDLACYAIMNLIEMEAQKKQSAIVSLLDYVECDVYKLHLQQRIGMSMFTASKCYGCKHTDCPYNRPNISTVGNPDISFESVKNAYDSTDPCEGCETKKMLDSNVTYIGDLPCQWCSKNPLRFTCVSGGTTSTHTLNNRKGETNNEK